MKNIKVWPHMTILAVLVAVLAGLGVAFYLKHEQTVQAESLPNAARIQRVDGEVAFSDAIYNQAGSDANVQENSQWVAAIPNQPFSVGDRIYTKDKSRTSLAFSGRNFARLNANTGLDVVTLTPGRTLVTLREGSAFFDVGEPGELFEVGTPYGAVDFVEPGLYNLGFDNNGNVLISVLSGVAQVVGLAGSGRVSKGELLTLAGTTAAAVALSNLNRDDAGYLVDDYYRYQYANVYDGRYSDYDVYLNDPYYYDPYRTHSSYRYASSIIPGIHDLDYYGDWRDIDGYGYCWHPRVDAGWAPYQSGYWVNDYPYGATWVSTEPWGFAPYHYGRWANAGGQWYWIPDRVNTSPFYSPALVAFFPLGSDFGWVPLGPGDVYVARYYDEGWQPHYFSRADLFPTRLVNLSIPGAVTVVPLDTFGRIIDPRIVRRVDQSVLAQVRPTLEPLLSTPLRNAALHSAWGRGKIDLPPGIAKRLDDRPVFISAMPSAPPFKKDLAKALRVERVPERAKQEKFNVRDDRRGGEATMNRQEVERLTREAERGNRQAQQQLEQQQREQQRIQRRAEQQPQGERVGQPAQPRMERNVPRERPAQPQARPQDRRAGPPSQPRMVQPRPAPRVERPRPAQPQVQRVGQPSQPRMVQPRPAPRVERPRPVQPRPAAPRVERPRPQQPQGQRVGNPVRQSAPREMRAPVAPPGPPQPAQPRRQAQQQAQPVRRPQAQQQSQSAPKRQNDQPAQPPAQGQGKGRGKKP